MLSPQTILANIKKALDVLNISASHRGDRIRPSTSESVPSMPPCKKLFSTQRPPMLNDGTSPPVCVSDMHINYKDICGVI